MIASLASTIYEAAKFLMLIVVLFGLLWVGSEIQAEGARRMAEQEAAKQSATNLEAALEKAKKEILEKVTKQREARVKPLEQKVARAAERAKADRQKVKTVEQNQQRMEEFVGEPNESRPAKTPTPEPSGLLDRLFKGR